MAFNNIRNYFQERLLRIKEEWSLFQSSGEDPTTTLSTSADLDVKRLYSEHRDKISEEHAARALESEYQQLLTHFKNRLAHQHQPFQFYSSEQYSGNPEDRKPAPGIMAVPLKYHTGQVVLATEQVPETGFQLHPLIQYLIREKYPQYLPHLRKYVRPLGTTEATFKDFNREQKPSASLPKDRLDRILLHVKRNLDATPYLPVHFVDTFYDKRPLSTGTGYHNRYSYRINAHAKYSAPQEFRTRPTSKGFYTNAFAEYARDIVHNIKMTGLPFKWNSSQSDANDTTLIKELNRFLNEFPTLLFTRNHISDKDGKLKQRPVYAVDELFSTIESMLAFPLICQARKMSCCIMYGLETIRGSNIFLDQVAQWMKFSSFFTIDWSEFDQRLPRVITDTFWTQFLPSLIVISHGYQPTFEYPTYPDLDEHKMYQRMDNLLHFLHFWYNNMTFLSLDGFAYRRTSAGVPSGLFLTQYLDSYGNLFLMIDGLIEFGCTDYDIEQILLFVMGDDNSGFTYWSISRLEEFIEFFEHYSLKRWNMVLSKTKSVITTLRNKIETLGYQCNFGKPKRPIPKLVAQLCYPEHGPKDKYMSARAIGMAYASCGEDLTFYQLCRDVYYTFLPYSEDYRKTEVMEHIISHLPGQFKMLDAYAENIILDHFPTLLEIQSLVSTWQGPLDFQPKWNRSHFVNDPDVIPPSAKTMADYRQENSITVIEPLTIPPS
ncbi:RNA-dependent RNA polymerase [Fusarium mangiferae partitivirus 1]|nr:RNA-dependent RNA polymerase [Fusarium mangiferae partitivirus 1]